MKRLRDYAVGQRDSSCWPSLGRLLLLQLLGRVFSVSDLRNDITGPASILLCQYLSQCPVSTLSDLCSGQLVCSILLTYHNTETRRYVPEVTAYLHTVLSCYLPGLLSTDNNNNNAGSGGVHSGNSGARKAKDFQSTFNVSSLTWLREQLCRYESNNNSSSSNDSNSIKVIWPYFSSKSQQLSSVNKSTAAASILSTNYTLIEEMLHIHESSNALPEIMTPMIQTLRSLRPQDKPSFPLTLQQRHVSLVELIMAAVMNIRQHRKPLQWRKATTVSIEMKNPRFQLDYTFKKDVSSNGGVDAASDQDRVKMKQLTRQLKREEKAAMRELRRDSAFIDQERYKEVAAAKEERRAERVKNFGWMEDQQATINQQVRKGNGLMKGGGSGVAKKARIKRL